MDSSDVILPKEENRIDNKHSPDSMPVPPSLASSNGKSEIQVNLGSKARHWFAKLSWEDRAAVLMIDDVAFVSTLASAAASVASSSGPIGSDGLAAVGGDLWGARVAFQDIEQAYNSYCNQMASPESGAVDDAAPQQSPGNKDSDAYRIHKEEISARATTAIKSESAAGAPTSLDGGENRSRVESAGELGDITDKVRLIFPEASTRLISRFSGLERDEKDGAVLMKKGKSPCKHPIIAFDSNFLESKTGNDLLFLLDRLARKEDAETMFLSNQRCNAASQSTTGRESGWLRCMKQVAEICGADGIPLHVMLLARIEVAVLEGYVQSTNVGGRLSSQSMKQRKVFLVLSKICKSLQSYAKKEGDAALNVLMTPVRSLLHGEALPLPEHVAFVPLSWVLDSTADTKGKLRVASTWRNWEGAIEQVSKALDLSAMDQMVKGVESDTTKGTNEVPGAVTKKKKKKKKKKKRKGSNAGVAADHVDPASPNLVAEEISVDIPSIENEVGKPPLVAGVDEVSDLSSSSLQHRGEAKKSSMRIKDTESSASLSQKSSNLEGKNDILGAELDKPPAGSAVAQSASKDVVSGEGATTSSKEAETSNEDDHMWETVESKSRGSRNKKQKAASSRPVAAPSVSSISSSTASAKKGKNGKAPNNRRRNTARKVAKEILSSVLDNVDDEVERLRQNESVAMLEEQKRRHEEIARQGQSGHAYGKAATLRDVVMGNRREKPDSIVPLHSHVATQVQKTPESSQTSTPAGQVVQRAVASDDSQKAKASSTKGKLNPSVADQSTAPTVPETLSGVSAATPSSAAGVATGSAVDVDLSPSNNEPAKLRREPPQQTAPKELASPPPPLPTLLGPGSVNSASSSVASSLEAPHTIHHHHHHCSVVNEANVGYHLLDICNRLSRDMDVFMARRAAALTIRRRERGALVAALQDTAAKLWSGNCHVEMYGSCATGLDLPSSDVDAVICGLGMTPDILQQSSHELDLSNSHHFQAPMSPVTSRHSVPMQLSANAERVLRLAAELESLPWAVQVKAIPTATVPVVKILADPSRLPGAVMPIEAGGDWMMHQHHMAAQAAAAAGGIYPSPSGEEISQPQHYGSSHPGQTHYQPNTLPPWRGADVMNGLFSVDITFEGPEHGGIGSTAFSAQVVQDACNEAGLSAEQTPVVQVLMVLKELLAQRRLNEPFSGGLSSYALLLLVVAVLKERGAIRKEIERTERQRMVVAAECCTCGTCNSRPGSKKEPCLSMDESNTAPMPSQAEAIAESKSSEKAPHATANADDQRKPTSRQSSTDASLKKSRDARTAQRKDTEKNDKTVSSSANAPVAGASSWASIAKKSAASQPRKIVQATNTNVTQDQQMQKKPDPHQSSPPKAATFADIVNKNKAKATPAPTNPPAAQSEKEDSKVRKNPKQNPAPKPSETPAKATGGPKTIDEDTKATSATQPTQVTPEKQKPNGASNAESGYGGPSLFPQGTNDVLEVLCSGETTAGKLFMHFLLFYGQHFDSPSTAIDVSGTHHPDYSRFKAGQISPSEHLTPFVPRKSGGSIDPYTGMLTVDPIIVYDPLEGAENNNVARSCYAWSSIRWVFAQSYTTLSSVVERSETPPTTPAGEKHTDQTINRDTNNTVATAHAPSTKDAGNVPGDMVSPLLEMLLSF